MKTFIIEIHPFPHIMGMDKVVKVIGDESDDLDTILDELNDKLKKQNSRFEYDLYGYTLEEFLDGIETIEL
jgi:uncharacterized Zn finger protein